ncbi:hypothetical protein E0493_22715 [Roseomonas sp. M0104]|uniref:DUF202 domain-containing protein n=1 Tax=Teichococcus coralli TaxID=2545983 RepID=A0A845BGL4_9PROT|nr:hypothetical protein [Pseudoroseomonas coralli]MXP66145.1 hypothetical protein [Pseudoroseomonas coralli]
MTEGPSAQPSKNPADPEWRKRRHEFRLARLNGSLGFATSGMNALLLANGAATLGLLQFFGSLFKETITNAKNAKLVRNFVLSCSGFSAGVVLAVATSVLAFIVMDLLREDYKSKRGAQFRCAGLTTAILSLLAFLFGIYFAVAAVRLIRP